MIDPWCAHQGAAAEQLTFGVLHVAAGAGDGAGQGGAQARFSLAILGLEQVRGRKRRGAEAQVEVGVAHEQADGGMAAAMARL
ncbi:hypothetical protein D3C85_1246720 [compost metagenome]